MDQRQKLKDAYMPDKKTQGATVVLGLSGGIKSMVTASLLKIQKYDLIAVTIINEWEGLEGDQSRFLSCHIGLSERDRIKAFCHQLGIPHYFVKSSAEFREEVVESWMASKVSGEVNRACASCHTLRMKLLYQKMKQLGAKSLATGHLAKIFHEGEGGYIHSSNDEANDQSALLSQLPQEILAALMLPLSDLQKKEVVKLGENFQIASAGPALEISSCLPVSPETLTYLSNHVPASLLKAGEIMSLKGEDSFGQHDGVIFHEKGKTLNVDLARERNFFVEFNFSKKSIKLAGPEYFERNTFQLTHCQRSQEIQWLAPLRGVVHVKDDEYVECWVHPKNLNSAYLELDAPMRLVEGQSVAVFKKKGKNSKVYLSGRVRYLPQVEVESSEEEGKNEKIDHSRDW